MTGNENTYIVQPQYILTGMFVAPNVPSGAQPLTLWRRNDSDRRANIRPVIASQRGRLDVRYRCSWLSSSCPPRRSAPPIRRPARRD